MFEMWESSPIVKYYLYSNGIDQSYKVQFWHGEAFTVESLNNRRDYTKEEANDDDDNLFHV